MPPLQPHDHQGHLVANKVVQTTIQSYLHHHHLLPPLDTTIKIDNVLETEKPTTTTMLLETTKETTTETTTGQIHKNRTDSQKHDKTINPSIPSAANTLLWLCC